MAWLKNLVRSARSNMHIPVLLKETIDGLALIKGDVVVDGTLGGAGHSEAILTTQPDIVFIGLDVDSDALVRAADRLKPFQTKARSITLLKKNFRDIDKALIEAGSIDQNGGPFCHKVLLDFGWSSFQIESSGRGFSFKIDEPLVMTLAKQGDDANSSDEISGVNQNALTADTIVNEWAEESLADIIYGYGEDRYARRIAKAIVEARQGLHKEGKRIATTGQLAVIIERAVPKVPLWKKNIHPVTKTFQALRITVNDELGAIETFLKKIPDVVAVNGRVALISFHSLEDRLVKRAFKELAQGTKGKWRIITKRPLTASDEELEKNPRARSAKLRIIERIG